MTADFPSLIPSSRVYTPGVYPHANLLTMGGGSTQVRHSNNAVGDRLSLTFKAADSLTLVAIRQHFIKAGGGFESFLIDEAVWSGTPDPTRPDCTWRYAAPPAIVDVGCGKHDITVELEIVPDSPPPLSQIIFYATAEGFKHTVIQLDPAVVGYAGERDNPNYEEPDIQLTGGPFNEPYVAYTPLWLGNKTSVIFYELDGPTIEGDFGRGGLQLQNEVDMTVEGWLRLPSDWLQPDQQRRGTSTMPFWMDSGQSRDVDNNFSYSFFQPILLEGFFDNPAAEFVAYPMVYSNDGGTGYFREYAGANLMTKWWHFAYVRKDGISSYYFDGVKFQENEIDFQFGDKGDSTDYTGPYVYISPGWGEFGQWRIVVGRALYETDTIQVPTAPFIKP
jgi:hypothetical protein